MQSHTYSKFKRSSLAILIVSLSLTAGGNAVAQDDKSGSTLEEIITIGTRSHGRTAIESGSAS